MNWRAKREDLLIFSTSILLQNIKKLKGDPFETLKSFDWIILTRSSKTKLQISCQNAYRLPDSVHGEHLQYSYLRKCSKNLRKIHSKNCMKTSNTFGCIGVFLRIFLLEKNLNVF